MSAVETVVVKRVPDGPVRTEPGVQQTLAEKHNLSSHDARAVASLQNTLSPTKGFWVSAILEARAKEGPLASALEGTRGNRAIDHLIKLAEHLQKRDACPMSIRRDLSRATVQAFRLRESGPDKIAYEGFATQLCYKPFLHIDECFRLVCGLLTKPYEMKTKGYAGTAIRAEQPGQIVGTAGTIHRSLLKMVAGSQEPERGYSAREASELISLVTGAPAVSSGEEQLVHQAATHDQHLFAVTLWDHQGTREAQLTGAQLEKQTDSVKFLHLSKIDYHLLMSGVAPVGIGLDQDIRRLAGWAMPTLAVYSETEHVLGMVASSELVDGDHRLQAALAMKPENAGVHLELVARTASSGKVRAAAERALKPPTASGSFRLFGFLGR